MDAIRFLYLRYKNNVYGYILSIVRDEYEAEDATQHVFLKLISVIQQYEPREAPFASWILRIARNVAVDYGALRRGVRNLPRQR
jgi:RNA polymerase sigma-70 factor (ECF subfamily)